ncbi:Epi-isozizaene 5-monooxygenase/(E)-beta-farnesene synthase [Mycobacterium simulans]|uniref:Epi-isozizaene 5-monooxygenase/(E)-beta-farnesene synthase n=1 Tax=Mycobacterium simulans TaxID=627089 RepID=A0A7Z7IKH7_9MYCO|nr:cytochrome P450 [Mycobacterium simulans]SOJ55240.1 Epi-isozizaene 5-monooxygenase/(E)-beta-farnesene synthase [Mycobacterium simulans]
MNSSGKPTAIRALPLVPENRLPRGQQMAVIKDFYTGIEKLRDAGGGVTRLKMGPKWLLPQLVLATSAQAAHDILRATGSSTEVTLFHDELRHLLGSGLVVLRHERWLPRRRALQPIFTQQHVRTFGGHMARIAETMAETWQDVGAIDLDVQCRRLTMRALSRLVLGVELDEELDTFDEALREAVGYAAVRAARPVRAPRWLPTPARRRARAASATLHGYADKILQACRADATSDAPLVRALLEATDADTGRKLSDDEIRSDLIVFMFAGRDTTALTLSYALWMLGRHLDMQERVRAEVAEIGDRDLTSDDVPRLGYTIQVIREAMRLCPPTVAVSRVVTKDIEVAGYRVDAGTMCSVAIYALNRDPAAWDRPLEFDPDRFNAENSAGRDRWQYIPFGAGPRSCIGNHFAMLEATLALSTIIRRTEIRSLDDEFPLPDPWSRVASAPIRVRVGVPTAHIG